MTDAWSKTSDQWKSISQQALSDTETGQSDEPRLSSTDKGCLRRQAYVLTRMIRRVAVC